MAKLSVVSISGIKIVMARERQIKVVKRGERERLQQEVAEKVVHHQTPNEAARSLVATVTEWIKESRQNRRDSFAVLHPRLER
jgi:DNA-binding helix-hairpin-helix protein with protein kinase domain